MFWFRNKKIIFWYALLTNVLYEYDAISVVQFRGIHRGSCMNDYVLLNLSNDNRSSKGRQQQVYKDYNACKIRLVSQEKVASKCIIIASTDILNYNF